MPYDQEYERPRRSDRHTSAGRRRASGQRPRAQRTGGTPRSGSTRSHSKGRRIAFWTIGVLLVLILAVGGYALFMYFRITNQMAPSKGELKAIRSELDGISESSAETTASYILLLGNDRRSSKGWARSDTIAIARLDPDTKQVSILSIPRDSRVAVPGHGMTKINHAAAYGGPALTIKTVKALTGLPIHHYVQIDFEGFESIVDAVGGVTMNVDRQVLSGNGAVLVHTGTQNLSGKQALLVVRNRHSYAQGDFARMRNQQLFLLALAQKMSQSDNYARLPKILTATSNNIQTDMQVGEILDYGATYRGRLNSQTMKSASAPGYTKTIDRVSYVILKDAEFQALIGDMVDGGFEGDE